MIKMLSVWLQVMYTGTFFCVDFCTSKANVFILFGHTTVLCMLHGQRCKRYLNVVKQ